MTRSCILAIFLATGAPLVGSFKWTVAAVAVCAAAMLLTGLKRRSLRIAVIGSMLAICELALGQVTMKPDFIKISTQPGFACLTFVLPAAVGLALLYVVEEVNFARHAMLAHVDKAARQTRRRAQLQQAIAAVTIAAVAMSAAIMVLGSGLVDQLQISASMRTAAAGIGALIALLASFAAASRRPTRRSRAPGRNGQ